MRCPNVLTTHLRKPSCMSVSILSPTQTMSGREIMPSLRAASAKTRGAVSFLSNTTTAILLFTLALRLIKVCLNAVQSTFHTAGQPIFFSKQARKTLTS